MRSAKSARRFRSEPHVSPLSAFIVLIVWALPVLSLADEAIELRVFSRAEVIEGLAARGITDELRGISRLPDASGVRIALRSGDVVELRCDGALTRRQSPGRRSYFNADGEPFAWYEGNKLRFAESSPHWELGNAISVDPNGRFLVTIDGLRAGRRTLVFSTGDLANPLGSVPLAGPRTRVFSSDGGIIVVGDSPDQDEQVPLVIVYELQDGKLLERERIGVPRPDTWFGGRLVASDAERDGSEVAFQFSRDPPLANRLYEFSLRTRELRHVSKLRGTPAYVACNPFSNHEQQ